MTDIVTRALTVSAAAAVPFCAQGVSFTPHIGFGFTRSTS